MHRKGIFTLLLFTVLTTSMLAQTVGTYFNDPAVGFESVTVGADGTIYSVDFSTGVVHRLRPNGSLLTIPTEFSNLAGGGLGPGGLFYFCAFNEGRIYRLNADNTYSLLATGLSQPVGLVLSADSTFFYVANNGNNTIQKVALNNGAVTDFASGGGIFGPDGVVLMPNGDLLVANFRNHRLHRVNAAGEVTLFGEHPWVGQMGYVARIGEEYYVPSFSGHTIARFDAEGNPTIIAGGASGYVDGAGEDARFSAPNGIYPNATGDTLFLSENGGRISYLTDLDEINGVRFVPEPTEWLQLFPIPTNDYLRLRYTGPQTGEIQILLLDTAGRTLVDTGLLDSPAAIGELRMDQFPPGVYVLQLWRDGQLRQLREVIRR